MSLSAAQPGLRDDANWKPSMEPQRSRSRVIPVGVMPMVPTAGVRARPLWVETTRWPNRRYRAMSGRCYQERT